MNAANTRFEDRPVADAAIDEWLFVAWTPDGSVGVISGHRLLGSTAWYWSAHVRSGYPLLHLAEWEVKVRPDPMVVKAPEMWAEHLCEAPLQQWSIGNEAYFAELDQADEALGRGYGIPTPTAFDLEWYATETPDPVAGTSDDAMLDHQGPGGSGASGVGPGDAGSVTGFEQVGVVHGIVEVVGRPTVELVEAPAMRWRRTTKRVALDPVGLGAVVAHVGLRAPFRFPDGAVADWVLTPTGWRARGLESAPEQLRSSR